MRGSHLSIKMMSLVAYGSSGESDNESDSEVEPLAKGKQDNAVNSSNASKSQNGAAVHSHIPVTNGSPSGQASASKSGLHSKLPAPKKVDEAIPEEEDEEPILTLGSKLPPPKKVVEEIIEEVDEEPSLALASKLPAPKHHTTPSLIESAIVLPKGPKDKGKKLPVRISIPSLSDFPEDDDEPKARKKIQPSAKGSGLFALLPPPKQATVKEANRSLVPNVLTRKPNPTPPVKKPLPKPSVGVKRKQADSDPESDGENESGDFFSLNKEDKLPEIPMSEIPFPASSDNYQQLDNSISYENSSSSQQPIANMEYQYQPYDNQAGSSAESALPQANSGQDFISFSGGGDLQLDDEALKKLCGRRRNEDIQILDVSGDQIMPDQREWLTKQLTEEQPRHTSKRGLHGPSSQQKRKHQITYLAHIAKENELELKNQWANNRQSRKQTQSKYGF